MLDFALAKHSIVPDALTDEMTGHFLTEKNCQNAGMLKNVEYSSVVYRYPNSPNRERESLIRIARIINFSLLICI